MSAEAIKGGLGTPNQPVEDFQGPSVPLPAPPPLSATALVLLAQRIQCPDPKRMCPALTVRLCPPGLWTTPQGGGECGQVLRLETLILPSLSCHPT